MKTVQISLNSIDKVKSFVNEITKFDHDFDLVSGRYVIDAKSISACSILSISFQQSPTTLIKKYTDILRNVCKKI